MGSSSTTSPDDTMRLRTTAPPDVFSRDLHQPSVKTDDAPEPEKASTQPEAPSAQSEAPSAQPEAPSAPPEAPSTQPEAPSAPEGEALRVEDERSGVTPNRNWQTPYLQYLHQGELPLDEPRLGDWRGVPSRSSCWGTRRSSTTAAPQASSSDAYPSPKARSSYEKYTRGLRSSRSAPSPCWKRLPTRFLLADRGGQRH
jgi:hypothetical protein